MSPLIRKWFWKIVSLPVELLAYIALAALFGVFGFVIIFGMIAFIVVLIIFFILIIFLLLSKCIKYWYIASVKANRELLGERRASKQFGIRDYFKEVCYDGQTLEILYMDKQCC
jgi:uncharacterized membrane protein